MQKRAACICAASALCPGLGELWLWELAVSKREVPRGIRGSCSQLWETHKKLRICGGCVCLESWVGGQVCMISQFFTKRLVILWAGRCKHASFVTSALYTSSSLCLFRCLLIISVMWTCLVSLHLCSLKPSTTMRSFTPASHSSIPRPL